jgi:hypothetical protein
MLMLDDEKSWPILQISLLDRVQMYRTRLMSMALPTRIYTFKPLMEKNFMRF